MPISERKIDARFGYFTGQNLDGRLTQRKLNRRHMFETFQHRPIATAVNGAGAAVGTTGSTNLMLASPENQFEYHIKGTQTILSPALGTYGLDISMDIAVADDGVELSCGITNLSKMAFTVGTDKAFYARLKAIIPDVSGSDDFNFGFRRTQAYQTGMSSYTDFAVLSMISGDIKSRTNLNSGGVTTTDTTQDWVDGATRTLEVRVSAAGAVTYYIDGVQTLVPPAFTFDSGDVVVPFFFFLHDIDIAQGTELLEWECGFLDTKE